MAGVVVSLVLDNFKGPMAHRMILVTLADHANKDGSEARPSMQKLADRAGVSKRHARRIVSDLRNDGWIYPVTDANEHGTPVGGRSKITVYQIDIMKLKENRCRTVKADSICPPLVTSDEPKRRTPRDLKEDTTGPKGGHPRVRVKDKPSRTVQNRPWLATDESPRTTHPTETQKSKGPGFANGSSGWVAGEGAEEILKAAGVNGNALKVLVADARITPDVVRQACDGLGDAKVRDVAAVLVSRLTKEFGIQLGKGPVLDAEGQKLAKTLETQRRKR